MEKLTKFYLKNQIKFWNKSEKITKKNEKKWIKLSMNY